MIKIKQEFLIKLTPEQIEARKAEYKGISDFMNDTYDKCCKLGISISINIKTGRMGWHRLLRNDKRRK